MTKPRDYAAEYQRRVARGEARGLSRSQARGHPKAGESLARKPSPPRYDKRLEVGLKAVRDGKTLKDAARDIHVDQSRLRNYLAQTGAAEKQGGRWRITQDNRQRRMPLYSGGKAVQITVKDYDTAYRVGRYMAAVSEFLRTNDASLLDPYKGASVTDVKGKQYVFETRLNTLYRLSAAGSDSFEAVYRIIA